MARVKNQTIPSQDVLYQDGRGNNMYTGDTYRGVATEGYYTFPVGDMSIVKKSSRQRRQRSLGAGSPHQRNLRKVFKACAELWRTLPADCAGYCGCDPLTTKKSVYEAKNAFGIICTYFDLWMKCCLDNSLSKIPDWRWGGPLQDKSLYLPMKGECFPDPCIAEIASTISYETALMELDSYQTIEIGDEYPGACYKWASSPPNLGTFIPEWKTYWSPTVAPDPPACITISLFISDYPCVRLLDQIEICFEVCNDDEVEYSDIWSADTIVRNGTATVVVTNPSGLGGPFQWSVGGTGFSMGAAETESGVNTLYAGPTACGTATIYIATCTGRVVTGYVRCTYGAWAVQPKGYVWPHEPVASGTVIGNLKLIGGYQNCYGASGGFPYSDPWVPGTLTKDEASEACSANFLINYASVPANNCCWQYQLLTQGCLQNILPPYPPPAGWLGSWNKWWYICEDQGSIFRYAISWYQCTARVYKWGC